MVILYIFPAKYNTFWLYYHFFVIVVIVSCQRQQAKIRLWEGQNPGRSHMMIEIWNAHTLYLLSVAGGPCFTSNHTIRETFAVFTRNRWDIVKSLSCTGITENRGCPYISFYFSCLLRQLFCNEENTQLENNWISYIQDLAYCLCCWQH